MVLDRRDGDHVAGPPVEQAGGDVEALRRRPREHHPVVCRVGAHERPDDLACLLIDVGGQSRLEPRPAVDARGPVEELVHGLAHRPERGGRGGLVEVRVSDAPAVGDRDPDIRADPQVRHRHVGSGGGWSGSTGMAVMVMLSHAIGRPWAIVNQLRRI